MSWLLTERSLRNLGVPEDEVARFSELYPKGCPLNVQNALECETRRIDMVNIGCLLMLPERRPQFMFYTLIQRRALLSELFKMVGLSSEAKTIKSINWAEAETFRVIVDIHRSAVDRCESERDDRLRAVGWIAAHFLADAATDAHKAGVMVLAISSAEKGAKRAVQSAGLTPPKLLPGDITLGANEAVQAGLNATEVAMALPYTHDSGTASVFSKCAATLHTDERAYLSVLVELHGAASAKVRTEGLARFDTIRQEQIRWIWATLSEDF